jgi:hypothetical protein
MSATAAAVVSALAAVISAACAVLTYRLTRKTQAEVEAEERLYAGQPTHPDLHGHNHRQAVIYCALFNKSTKKRAFVNAVRAFGDNGTEIEITWSDRIDDLGNPVMPSNLVAVPEQCHIYARRNDGEGLSSGTLKIFHSFKNSPLVLTIDPWKA